MMEKQTKKKWYAFVPNLLTLANLLCGTIAVYLAFNGEIVLAVYLMFAGALFDFFDGFVARLLKVSGELGKQLDSLADVITFGFLPGALAFMIQSKLLGFDAGETNQLKITEYIYLSIPLLIPAFSALRLAKFNIDTRQSHSFIGLPTPANALFFAALALIIFDQNAAALSFLHHPLLIAIIVVVFSLLLVAEIPLFSLKFTTFKGKENFIRYLFLAVSLGLLLLFSIKGLGAIILLYLLLSIINNMTGKSVKS